MVQAGWNGLSDLLGEHGQVAELRTRADAGDHWAAERLVDLLGEEGQVEELRPRADAGDLLAARRLVRLLVDQSRVEELQAEVDAGTLRWVSFDQAVGQAGQE